MSVLQNLEPKKVFAFFEEIAQIPHGSGNTAQIAAYCMRFAEERGLRALHDAGGNVIIYAPGTAGYENSEPIILQGHMDMVCEKTPDCTKNMEKDGLTLATDGNYVWAEGTTLGGDDGIALAYMFALLDSDDIPHPPLECVITRDEETGMFGAELFEAEHVRGRKILNIDSEEEGILTVSCAGGVTVMGEIPMEAAAAEGFAYLVTVGEMTGGHSGADIHHGRQNGIRVLGQLLGAIAAKMPFRAAQPMGGGKANVIPKGAQALVVTQKDSLEALEQITADFAAAFAAAHGATDAHAVFAVAPVSLPAEVLTEEATARLLGFLADAPTGVIRMHPHMEGMVQTSLNLGVMQWAADKLSVQFLIRSNVVEEKQWLMEETEAYIRRFGGTPAHDAGYPAWEYREDSTLRDLMVQVFEEQYGRKPQVSAIHAGLECGLFAEKIKNADIVSIGPDIADIHTPDERLDVASAASVWEYVKEILRRSR